MHQRSLLKERLPGMSVVADLSWGLTDGVVLHVRATGRDLVVKAGSPQDHHIGREIAVHRAWVGCLATQGRAPRLLWADESAHLLVTGYVEGELVLGAEAERHLETYAQAGALVARFHGQAARTDADYERRSNARTLRWLDGPHAIAADVEAQLRAVIAAFPSPATVLVPTHGDWQPRNWLHHQGLVHVIDFGRADWRPAESDLARLAVQHFTGRPDLEEAHVEGYGSDTRDAASWRRTQLREAVGNGLLGAPGRRRRVRGAGPPDDRRRAAVPLSRGAGPFRPEPRRLSPGHGIFGPRRVRRARTGRGARWLRWSCSTTRTG